MTLVHPVSFESNSADTTVDDTAVQNTTENTPVEATEGPTFHQLGLPQPLVTALERRGIHRPFAIQTSALPDPSPAATCSARPPPARARRSPSACRCSPASAPT